ncbi:MAG: NAD(P)/FAD-dependent oxidoreductase [Clostridia bacterium]|nr:NAD(P)/FAD-dependent oxidoreductase [Clostridia bacterium]
MSKKVIVIGAGPAGITSAIYLHRAGIETLVLHNGIGGLEKADKIENYYGFETAISGQDLFENGIKQAENIGIKVIKSQVYAIAYNEQFEITTEDETYKSDAVIMANGISRNKPAIENLSKYEGAGVSYCATCDGFFYKDLNVGVLGNSEYTLHEAQELLPIAKNVTIFTNGKDLEVEDETFTVNNKKIKSLSGKFNLENIEFEDGEKIDIDGLFIAAGVASGTDLAKKIGVLTDDKGGVIVDDERKTNVPGIFAAGDCTRGLLQVSKAVYDGAVAAKSAIAFLRK